MWANLKQTLKQRVTTLYEVAVYDQKNHHSVEKGQEKHEQHYKSTFLRNCFESKTLHNQNYKLSDQEVKKNNNARRE